MVTPTPKKVNASQIQKKSSDKFWEVGRSTKLPREFNCPLVDLFDLLEVRRSRREFEKMSIQDISTLLWFTQRHTATIPNTTDRVKSPVATAGALASVRTAVLRPREKAWVYDAARHQADVLSASIDACDQIRTSANKFFSIGGGSLLLFFAHRPLVRKYYKSPESLILREAGVLLGALALVAEALEFSFCPLGTTAEDWLIAVLGVDKGAIIPAGAAVIGRRQSTAVD